MALNDTIVANSPTGGNLSNALALAGLGTFTGSHNLIDDKTGTKTQLTGTIGGDAGLGRQLADNGGPTKTFALQAGSQAINKGSNALAVDAHGNPLLYDQRGPGFPRVVGTAVDIGATEFTEVPAWL